MILGKILNSAFFAWGLAGEVVKKPLEGKALRKVIVAQKKLVNIVV